MLEMPVNDVASAALDKRERERERERERDLSDGKCGE